MKEGKERADERMSMIEAETEQKGRYACREVCSLIRAHIEGSEIGLSV